MKIQTIPVSAPSGDEAKPSAEVGMLKVFGPVDPNDAVIRRARELVVGTGSRDMIESFDWALAHGSFVTEE
jgi:hypothetical protein